jgi:hypothetical protein
MQYPIIVQNGSGAEVRGNINNAFQSVATDVAGATDPSTMTPSNAFAFCLWLDTGNGLLKRRNANNTAWNNIGTVDSSGNVMLFGVYGQSGVLMVIADTTLAETDSNKLIVANSSNNITITMPAPTEYMSFKFFNRGTGTVTITNGTFYGESGMASNVLLNSNQSVSLSSDGTNFYAI